MTYGLVVQEVGRGDSAMRTVISVQTSLVCSSILKYGTEEQKHKYLPKLCSGEWFGCFGLTEPDTGSDAANQRTRATRVDGGWKINGSKMFISLGSHAKVAMIFAQTDPSLGHKGLGAFLVDTDQPGYVATEIKGKMGLHASDTASIALDDVFCADEDVLGPIGKGFSVAMSSLDSGRYSVASGCVGICQGALDASVQYAKERDAVRQADRLVPARAVDAGRDEAAHRRRAAADVCRAGWLKDQGQPNTLETSIAKLYATEAAQWVANEAIQVHGGSGYVDDHPVERMLRDVRVTTLYEGTSQIQKLIIGRFLDRHQRGGVGRWPTPRRSSACSAPERWARASRSSRPRAARARCSTTPTPRR